MVHPELPKNEPLEISHHDLGEVEVLGHGASDGGVKHGGVLEELGVIVAVVEGLKVFEDDGGRQRLTP